MELGCNPVVGRKGATVVCKVIYKTEDGRQMSWSCPYEMLDSVIEKCILKEFEIVDIEELM